jgi:hypothetical protein
VDRFWDSFGDSLVTVPGLPTPRLPTAPDAVRLGSVAACAAGVAN